MKNLSIKSKLWANLAIFLAFYAAMWGMSYLTSVKIGSYLDSSKIEIMKNADSLRQTLSGVEQLVNDAAQAKDMDMLLEADELASLFRRSLAALKSLDEADREILDKVRDAFEIYYKNARRAAMMIIKGKGTFDEDLLSHAEQVKRTLPELRRDVETILDKSYDTFSSLLDRSTKVASLLVSRNFALLAAVVALSLIVFPVVIRSITKPIEKLVHATNELAAGNLDTQAEVVSHDEIGRLALSFNRMAKTLKEKNAELEKTTQELSRSLEARKEMQRKIIEANRELKDANAKLIEADKLKSDFLASMSHELRTTLNAIINFTDQIMEDWDLLAEDIDRREEAMDMLKRVYKSSMHLLSLINDLLDLAKIESGYMTLDLAEVDIREIIADALTSVSPLAKEKSLKLSHSAPDDLPPFIVDERRVLQILINLLSNAIKFTSEGSVSVNVETTKDYPDGALIKVSDTGAGIPDSYLKIIFDRFRQAHGGDSRSHAGTGLGLNLVKELTELHGGWVKVESEVGKGSVFTIYLPIGHKK